MAAVLREYSMSQAFDVFANAGVVEITIIALIVLIAKKLNKRRAHDFLVQRATPPGFPSTQCLDIGDERTRSCGCGLRNEESNCESASLCGLPEE
jgi:hypothetical protein